MKKMKKLLCLATAVMTAASLSVAASAESNVGSGVQDGTSTEISAEDEGYILVSEEEYFDEDLQCNVIDRVYRKGDGIAAYADLSEGTDTIRREVTFVEKGFEWARIWVSGTFSWNSQDNTATVTNWNGGFTQLNNSAEILDNPKVEHGSNQGGFVGSKYAYVKKSVEMQIPGASITNHKYALEIDVNVWGELTIKRKR